MTTSQAIQHLQFEVKPKTCPACCNTGRIVLVEDHGRVVLPCSCEAGRREFKRVTGLELTPAILSLL